MTTAEYQTVEDVYAAVRQIRDKLSEHGERDAVAELDGTLKTLWTTGSEAVGEAKLSLLKVRRLVEKAIDSETLRLLDNAVIGATNLFNRGG